MENKLELRMYGMVNYQLSSIQSGIQFAHSIVEYGQIAKTILTNKELAKYDDWANNYKTVILLNGGTTNLNVETPGTMNQHLISLNNNDIFCAPFYESDLGDQLTALSFIVDERVFNKTNYPDFGDWLIAKGVTDGRFNSTSKMIKHYRHATNHDNQFYKEWCEFVGGDKNVFLREFLKSFKLA